MMILAGQEIGSLNFNHGCFPAKKSWFSSAKTYSGVFIGWYSKARPKEDTWRVVNNISLSWRCLRNLNVSFLLSLNCRGIKQLVSEYLNTVCNRKSHIGNMPIYIMPSQLWIHRSFWSWGSYEKSFVCQSPLAYFCLKYFDGRSIRQFVCPWHSARPCSSAIFRHTRQFQSGEWEPRIKLEWFNFRI